MKHDLLPLFLLAAIADAVFADVLTGRLHPVVVIGRLTTFLEGFLYPGRRDAKREFLSGAILSLAVTAATWGVVSGLLALAAGPGRVLAVIVEFYLLYALLACGGLARAAGQVLHDLEHEGLEAGRRALAGIVGRETGSLQEDDIYRALIETVAENFSDGVIAPVFYLLIGGLPLAWTYKAVNTLDSMIGYRDARYLNFGGFAARLDDLANFIPARVSALLILLAAGIRGWDWRWGWRIMRRDCRAHASPNSGWPEAAMAGVLGVRLGGANVYHGELVEKPFIGDDLHRVSIKSVRLAIDILYRGSGLGVILAAILMAL